MTRADREGADPHVDDGVRLQKVLAHAGIASRRASEDLISRGDVRVNGHVVRELGTRVDPQRDRITVKGVAVQTDQSLVYFALNKPAGVVSTMSDERGRPDLSQFAADVPQRIYNVGRLDTPTRGLLLMTNDGETAHRLAHPSFGVEKVYVARVRGRLGGTQRQSLLTGIELDDGPIAADRIRTLDASGEQSLVEVAIHSGRNRIVRRMFSAIGHPVIDLTRRQFGPIHLGTLAAGAMRELTKVEVGQLLTLSLRDTAHNPDRD